MGATARMLLVIAAAGRGARLREAGGGRAKPLIEVAGKSLLGWGLEHIGRGSVASVAIVANPAWAEACLAVASESLPGVPVWGVSQPEPLGTFDALQRALQEAHRSCEPALQGRPVGVLHADNVPIPGVGELALRHLPGFAAVLFSQQTRRPGSSAILVRDPLGVPVDLEKGRSARPGTPVEICRGFFVYGPGIWRDLMQRVRPERSGRGEWSLDELNRELVIAGRARVLSVLGPWIHVNTAEDLQRAEARLRPRASS